MAQVFISYSSKDLPKLQTILRRLNALRIDYWLDKDNVYGGAQWTGQIARAIEGCVLFLLIASNNSLKSDDVAKEINLAATSKKTILPLWIEEDISYTADVAYHLAGVQYIAAHNDPQVWFDRVVEAFRKANVTFSDLVEHVVPQDPLHGGIKVRTSLLPYLANRKEQETRIAIDLERHFENTPHRPIAIIMHGDDSQCIEGFIQRLELYTIPRQMARLKLPNHLEWKYAHWPIAPVANPQADLARQRAQDYGAEITDKLDLRISANAEAIAERIATFRRPVVFCSVINTEHWQPSEPALISRVLEFWAGMPNLPDTQPLIILLASLSRQPARSLLLRWFARQPSPELPAIRAAVDHARTLNLNAVVLPELADISLAEIEYWVRDVLRPPDPESAMARIREAFKHRNLDLGRAQAMAHLVPMLQVLLPSDAILRGS